MKFYAVKNGRTTGVFDNWAECNASINGFAGAVYKSFNTQEEAQAFLSGKDLWDDIVAEDIQQGYVVAFCDGSYDKNLNRYSYGIIIIDQNNNEISLCGHGHNEKYISSNNIIGEIFGVINALDWAVSNACEKIKIYHDYEGLSKWISGEWQAKSDVANMFISLYHSKFEGVLDVVFEKVKGHSNNKYNDKADILAKTALQGKTRLTIQGDHWFVLPYFNEKDFHALSGLVLEVNSNIKVSEEDLPSKLIYRFELENDRIVATLFKSKNQKVLVQGGNSLLFQIIVSIVTELDDTSRIEPILSNAYRTNIDTAKIDNTLRCICPTVPTNYPNNITRLIRQSIINLNYYVQSEDYSQYAFPALRALEGHIKYLITSAGGTVGAIFNRFNKDDSGAYVFTGHLSDPSKKPAIEKCYSYYKAQRHTIFHFGDILGATDSTRTIDNKAEADEIIKKCIALICEQQ